ncbi:hypothetical protein BBK82_44915 [Lentzea guizhouensis]|uniref:NB-ARC domain-containing protein n=1 Tax=Lentzea guizhouensis TaxID=1586287 RepID=A0A1B2HWA7_9PSEU|nr:hypothetical protein BBK82_44915 [Lentzea guizhouensis]
MGRERELSTVRRLLRRHRLVSLVGPGGSGKTRLAAELAPAEPGTAVVELESVHRPDLLWHVVAFSVNVWEEPGEPLPTTVVRALADHRLLVLDNCEHLVREAAGVVTTLLARCPRLRVLVTSREPLDLAGEMCVEVGPLAPADARRMFLELGGSPVLVDEACARVDHLPLAIELAAAAPDVPARHRTLDAVIRWSYDLLSPGEQAALRRLSVLVGDFDLDLAAAVCGCEDDVVQVMSSLRAKSLVVRSPSSKSARFRMLESIRLFGLARLEEHGETDSTFDRLATVLTRYVREVAATLTGETNDWFAEHEHQLLHAVANVPRTDPRYTSIVGGLVHIWYLRGSLVEAGRLATATLAEGAVAEHSELLLFRASWIAGLTGDGPAALRCAEALAAHPATRDPTWQARAWNTLGHARSRVGDQTGARDATERSVAAVRALGDESLLMSFLNNYAWLLREFGDLDTAATVIDEALGLGAPDVCRWTAARHTAGVIAMERGDLTRAEELFVVALRDGTPSCAADVLEGLGLVAAQRRQPERVVVLVAAAQAVRRSRDSSAEVLWHRVVTATYAAARRTWARRGPPGHGGWGSGSTTPGRSST